MLKRVLFYLLVVAVTNGNILTCNRTLKEAGSASLGNYLIEISGNPSNYVPGEQYTGKEIAYSIFVQKFILYFEKNKIPLSF